MVGVGVLGCGYWGPKLIRSLQATEGFRMAAACDLKEGRRDYVRQRHPGVDVLADPDALLAREDIQALWIATPVSTHVPFARRALESGKHVLVEKPMATSRAEAAELVELARRRRLALHTGHTFLFSPAVALLRQLIREGAHGTTCYLSSERINPGPPLSEVSVLWDLAVHDVAILIDLLGAAPFSVAARCGARRKDGLVEAVFVHLEFPGGVAAQVHASWKSARKTRLLKVFGTTATLIYDDLAEAPVQIVGAPADNRPGAADTEALELAYGGGATREYRPEGPEPLRSECEAFLGSIQSGAPAPNAGRRAVAVIETLEAAERSLDDSGRTLPVRHAIPLVAGAGARA